MKTRSAQRPIWRDANRLLLGTERAARTLARRYSGVRMLMQVGNQFEVVGDDDRRIAGLHHSSGRRIERPGWTGGEAGLAWPLARLDGLRRRLTRQAWSRVWIAEEGWLKGGLKQRLLRRLSLG